MTSQVNYKHTVALNQEAQEALDLLIPQARERLRQDQLWNFLLTERGLKEEIASQFCLDDGRIARNFNLPPRKEQLIYPVGSPGKWIYAIAYRPGEEPKCLFPSGWPKPLLGRENLRYENCPAVEGLFDYLSFIQESLSAVCTLGNNPSREQLEELKKSPSPVIMYDSDDRGREGAERLAEVLFPLARIASLPEGEDPNSLAVRLGPEFRSEIQSLNSESRGLLDIRLSQIEQAKEEDRLKLTRERVIPLMARLDGLEADVALRQLWGLLKSLGVRKDTLRELVVEATSMPAVKPDQGGQVEMTEEERTHALELLQCPDILDRFIAATERLGHIGEDINKKTIFLGMTSRKLVEPIDLTVKGGSAGGKNFTVGTVARFIPPEEKFEFTELSAKALYHRKDDLRHKVLIIYERVGSESADYPIRSFQSEGKLLFSYPAKNPDTGKFETLDIEVEGPIAYIETTTKATIHDENETRVFDLYIDESEEQTERIIEIKKRRAKGELTDDQGAENILRPWRNAQRLLRQHRVLIPYVDAITFPTKPLRVRRDFPRFLALIEALALLHQYQRETVNVNGQEFLLATLDDYGVAYDIATRVLRQTLIEITPTAEKILAAAWELTDAEEDRPEAVWLTKRKLIEKTDLSEKTIRNHIPGLVNQGYLEEDASPGKATKYRVCKRLEEGGFALPTLEEVGKALEDGNPGTTLVNADYQGQNHGLLGEMGDPGKVGTGIQEQYRTCHLGDEDMFSCEPLPGLPGPSILPVQKAKRPGKWPLPTLYQGYQGPPRQWKPWAIPKAGKSLPIWLPS